MVNELVIRRVRLKGGKDVDIRIVGELIEEIGAGLKPKTSAATEIDGKHAHVLPGFVDAHTHLDKNFVGLPWLPHQAGPSFKERVESERRLLSTMNLDAERQSAAQVRLAISKGTTHIRTHVDIDTNIARLSYLEGVVATREKLKGSVTIQIVAFPQRGMLIQPGTYELMEQSLRSGADLVGGIDPATTDRDPVGHLDKIFGLAERFGVGIDVHLHELGPLGGFEFELIAERTRALGMQGRVTVSHAFCLGTLDEPYLQEIIALLVENRIAIMSHAPGHLVFPPIKRLREAGVVVCSGSDGVRDAWSPYGNADMLERAMIVGYRSAFRRDEDLEMMLDIVTHGGAGVVGADGYGIEKGCRADLVLMTGENRIAAIMDRAPRPLVIKGGRIVARDGECLV